jgi:hypothetical protein
VLLTKFASNHDLHQKWIITKKKEKKFDTYFKEKTGYTICPYESMFVVKVCLPFFCWEVSMLGNEMFFFCIETLDVYAFQHYSSKRDFWNSLISIFPQSLFMFLF